MPRLTVYVNGKPLEVDLCPDDDLTSMACEVEKLDKRVNPAFTEISVDGQEKSKDQASTLWSDGYFENPKILWRTFGHPHVHQASPLWSDGYFENPKILWRPNHFSLSLYICRAAVQVPSTRMWSDYKEALESLEPELQTYRLEPCSEEPRFETIKPPSFSDGAVVSEAGEVVTLGHVLSFFSGTGHDPPCVDKDGWAAVE